MQTLNSFSAIFGQARSDTRSIQTEIDAHHGIGVEKSFAKAILEFIADFISGSCYSAIKSADSMKSYAFYKENIGAIRSKLTVLRAQGELRDIDQVELTNGEKMSLACGKNARGEDYVRFKCGNLEVEIAASIDSIIEKIDLDILEHPAQYSSEMVAACKLEAIYQTATSTLFDAQKAYQSATSEQRKNMKKPDGLQEGSAIQDTLLSSRHFLDNVAVIATLIQESRVNQNGEHSSATVGYVDGIRQMGAALYTFMNENLDRVLIGDIPNSKIAKQVTMTTQAVKCLSSQEREAILGPVDAQKATLVEKYSKDLRHPSPTNNLTSGIQHFIDKVSRDGITKENAADYLIAKKIVNSSPKQYAKFKAQMDTAVPKLIADHHARHLNAAAQKFRDRT